LRRFSTQSSVIFFLVAQVGGQVGLARLLDHIISEFYEALKRVQDIGYDLLDIAAKKYCDDFSRSNASTCS
jgi:hypothetical protein